MTPHQLPLRKRVPAALTLAPMTVDALARCLCASRDSVRDSLSVLRNAGAVVKAGTEPGSTRPWDVWRLAA